MLYSNFFNLLKKPNPVYAPNIGPDVFPVRDVPDDDVQWSHTLVPFLSFPQYIPT